MRWLVESRNRVVKSGDLELLSTARMRIISQYKDVASSVNESLPDGRKEIVKILPLEARPSDYGEYLSSIPRGLWKQSSLLVERRWVDKNLPEVELLDALAHCYGTLSRLLADAHKQSGGSCFIEGMSGSSDRSEKVSSRLGRLPCMITTLEARTAQYSLDGGELVQGEYRHLALDEPSFASKLEKRYGVGKLSDSLAGAESMFDWVRPLLEQAKRILRRDKHHNFMVFLFRGKDLELIESANFANKAEKFAYVRGLASKVASMGVTGMITIGEYWQSPVVLDEDGVPVPPGEVPDRQEILEVYAEDSSGRFESSACSFHRRFGRVYFGEEIEMSASMENNFMEPIRAAWGGHERKHGVR